MKLKAYQVGDNDIVAAYSSKQAIDLLLEVIGGGDWEDYAETTLVEGHRLTLPTYDEDGCEHESVQDMLDKLDKPQYMFGWE